MVQITTTMQCSLLLSLRRGLVLLSLWAAAAQTAEPVEVIVIDYPPYATEATQSGFLLDVVNRSFAHQKQSVEYRFLPTKRAYKEFLKGERLMFGTAHMLPEEIRSRVKRVPIFSVNNYLLYKGGNEKFLSEPPYNDALVGTLSGSQDETEISKLLGVKEEVYLRIDYAAKMLVAGRLDGMFCVDLTCKLIEERYPAHAFDRAEVSRFSLDAMLYSPKGEQDKELRENQSVESVTAVSEGLTTEEALERRAQGESDLRSFQRGLAAIIESGDFFEIRREYGVADYAI